MAFIKIHALDLRSHRIPSWFWGDKCGALPWRSILINYFLQRPDTFYLKYLRFVSDLNIDKINRIAISLIFLYYWSLTKIPRSTIKRYVDFIIEGTLLEWVACHFRGHMCCMSESKIYTMKSISILNLRNHFRLTWIIHCLKGSIDRLVAGKNENTFFFNSWFQARFQFCMGFFY